MRRAPLNLAGPGAWLLPGLCLVAACGAEVAGHDEWTLAAEEISRLGQDPVDVRTAFYQPADLGFDAAGHLYVLDSGNHRVQVFDAGGNWIATRGQVGEGPGDLQRPAGMWVEPNGAVVVADTGNRRLQGFAPNGAAETPIAVDYTPLDVVVDAERIVVLRLPTASFMLGPEADPLVHVLARDGTPLGAAEAPEPHDVGLLFFLLNTRRLAAGPDGGFALAHSHVASILRRYDRDGAPIGAVEMLYKADAWASLGRLPREVNDHSLDGVARTSSAVAWDPLRRLYWVVAGHVDRTADGEWITGTEVYRYQADGVYRGTVPLPFSAVAVAAAPDRTLWLIDGDGVLHQMRLHDPDLAPEP